MTVSQNASAGAHTGGGDRTPRESSLLVDVLDFAAMLRCSPRHIYRLCDSGRAPRPFKIGALCRWDRASIQQWIAEGCTPVRSDEGDAK